MGIFGIKLNQRHLVIVCYWVTKLSSRLRHLGQLGLHLHDVLHLLGSSTLAEAKELEHTYNMLFVGFTNLHCGFVVVKIVFFLTKRYTALADIQYVLSGILFVSTKTGTIETTTSISH